MHEMTESNELVRNRNFYRPVSTTKDGDKLETTTRSIEENCLFISSLFDNYVTLMKIVPSRFIFRIKESDNG